jgi:Arc/MetJ family transcription regulator
MATAKAVTITLPQAYIEAAKRAAAQDGTTVSGLAARALRNELLRRDMARLAAAGATTVDADVIATWEADRDDAR